MKKIKGFIEFINESAFSIKEDDYEKGTNTLVDLLKKYKSVKEIPLGSKEGPEISDWLRKAGAKPGQNWCMAFVYGIFGELAATLGIGNPLPKTAGVMDHWDKTDPSIRINLSDVKNDPDLLMPGMIFIMHRPKAEGIKNLGHTGIVISVDPVKKSFTSIEGNTKSGVGINTRSFDDPILVGFTDYFKQSRSPEFNDSLNKALNIAFGDDVQRIKFDNPAKHS